MRAAARELVETASSGNLDHALAAIPQPAQQAVGNAAREGFRTGLNEVLTLGALVSFAGAALALWLVREREIERQPTNPYQTSPSRQSQVSSPDGSSGTVSGST